MTKLPKRSENLRSPSRATMRPRTAWVLGMVWTVSAALMSSAGCSPITMPKTVFSRRTPENPYTKMAGGFEGDVDVARELYHGVRAAASNQSIVLQVDGEDELTRTLPLPPDGRPVYVSQLLEQSGVLKKFGAVDATLYRYQPNVVGGVRMAVKMSKDNTEVRPESDYTLSPGDRIHVQRAVVSPLQQLLATF